MPSNSFIAQILSPGGGIVLIPFTRAVICCLFIITSTVFILGIARIHMFIMSVLSAGMYISLGIFHKEYQKVFADHKNGPTESLEKKVTQKKAPAVSERKRED
eukprot:CAMPEP_0197248154 /NCGR_PEP_ID=MMETSP1429-20130617/35206_1 /TAXON_ID=49237 /ORGANISM="Chaetoceros  sp., Strain UNC1202" /LENGTH=102 /DNA_ID=CAMNT_0042709261 /DNA_START=101 /DNA_END=409 /DNA_ORIENTATION=+